MKMKKFSWEIFSLGWKFCQKEKPLIEAARKKLKEKKYLNEATVTMISSALNVNKSSSYYDLYDNSFSEECYLFESRAKITFTSMPIQIANTIPTVYSFIRKMCAI
jgi:hypothetical protein